MILKSLKLMPGFLCMIVPPNHRTAAVEFLKMGKSIRAPVAALLLTAMPTLAHHAFAAEYDQNKRVLVSGAVAKFTWTNPHAWLYVDTKEESGKVVPRQVGALRRQWSNCGREHSVELLEHLACLTESRVIFGSSSRCVPHGGVYA